MNANELNLEKGIREFYNEKGYLMINQTFTRMRMSIHE